jgi:hypothetical protein
MILQRTHRLSRKQCAADAKLGNIHAFDRSFGSDRALEVFGGEEPHGRVRGAAEKYEKRLRTYLAQFTSEMSLHHLNTR